MQVFDPTRGMNAFAQGAQIGGGIRQAQTNAKLAPMVAAGDYKGAAAYAGQRGDLPSAELYQSQYSDQLAQMGEADKKAAAERAQQLGKLAYGVRNLPYEQRQAAIANSLPVLQQMGMDPQSIQGFDPTDESLDTILAQVTDLSKMLEPKVVADGGQIWQGNRMIGENAKDPKAPATGMIQDENGNWVYSPEYLAGQERMRAAGRSQTNVTVNGDQPQNPYSSLPDGTPVDAPAGTKDLPAGQRYVVRGGQLTIENIPGGAEAAAAAEAERKRLGKDADTQQAGRTVVREVGRNLQLLPNIVGWGQETTPGQTETSGGLDSVAAANARIAMSKIAGTNEWKFVQNIESALSNVGLDKLQSMRDNSPTGGALGQVPIQQQQRLEQVLGSFKIGQDRPVVEENLKYLNNAYMDIMYGSEAEREDAVRSGRMTPQQNAEIQANYFDLNWNEFGRWEPVLPPEKQQRLEELRAKQAAGTIQ